MNWHGPNYPYEKDSMTRQQNTEAIRRACVAANPNIEISRTWLGGSETSVRLNEKINYRPIRLADVLLAISVSQSKRGYDNENHVWAVDTAGEFFGQSDSDGSPLYRDMVWNLRTDDLTAQSDECLAFISSLLTV